jgi:AMIN domain
VVWLLQHSVLSVKDFQNPVFREQGSCQPLYRFGPHSVLCLILAVSTLAFGLRSQPMANTKTDSESAPAKSATIMSLRIVQEKDGPAVEILSTKPLVPAIQAISDPPRLVIDLPNARLDAPKRISVQADQISALRADQFKQNPPIARVVVDLEAPRAYSWDSAGNRLVVHLGKDPNQASSSPFHAPIVASLASAPPPVVASMRAAGPLAIAGNSSGTGSSITAGPETAVLNLSSGGEVRVCPGTTLSATPSQNHHNVMLSMNTGALEAHLVLDASSDSVLTPDFRILLAGPGEFDYAISADSQGNTCVRSLPGNTASAVVTELLDDRTYHVKTTDQLVFYSGRLDRVDAAVPLECGCPPSREIPMRANSNLPIESKPPNLTETGSLPEKSANSAPTVETPRRENAPFGMGAPVASEASNELHIQITAPFVFHAGAAPAPIADVRELRLDSRAQSAFALAAPLPPPANRSPRGFFQKIGSFFASLFH